MENNSKETLTFSEDIDVNNPDFYISVQNETESDKAIMKKTQEVLKTLRIEAAELEIQTAQLYHADLWHIIQDMKMVVPENNKHD